MKWLLAAFAFAALVGLAVATAAIQTGNVRLRSKIEQISEHLDAIRVDHAAELERWNAATRRDVLSKTWLEMRARFAEAGT